MLSVKDGDFSRRAEFLKGHLHEAAAGAKHQSSWAPEGGEHVMLTEFVTNKQTGSRFLGLAVARPHPAQNGNKNTISSKS